MFGVSHFRWAISLTSLGFDKYGNNIFIIRGMPCCCDYSIPGLLYVFDTDYKLLLFMSFIRHYRCVFSWRTQFLFALVSLNPESRYALLLMSFCFQLAGTDIFLTSKWLVYCRHLKNSINSYLPAIIEKLFLLCFLCHLYTSYHFKLTEKVCYVFFIIPTKRLNKLLKVTHIVPD